MENGVGPGDFDIFEIGKFGGTGDGYWGEEARRARGRGADRFSWGNGFGDRGTGHPGTRRRRKTCCAGELGALTPFPLRLPSPIVCRLSSWLRPVPYKMRGEWGCDSFPYLVSGLRICLVAYGRATRSAISELYLAALRSAADCVTK